MIETYVIHSAVPTLLVGGVNLELDRAKYRLGRAKALLIQAGPPVSLLTDESATEEFLIQRANSIANILETLNDFTLELLDNIPLQCEPDIFMEILLNNVRNESISYQCFINKSINRLKSDLSSNLLLAKSITVIDLDQIDRLELRLNKINEEELVREAEKYSIFEQINFEKMTPHFLKIAKSARPDAKLSDICKPDGSDFTSASEQNEHIVSHFENIYKLPANHVHNVTGCIENFLGEELLQNQIILNSNITAGESAILEGALTLAELDQALNETKTRTAAGPDGISNAFLKRFWKYLRLPLAKYAGYCFRVGSLSPSFSTAQVHLIPKKGDCSKIETGGQFLS